MSKYVLLIGYSPSLLGTEYLAALTKFSEFITDVLTPNAGFISRPLIIKPSTPVASIHAFFKHDINHVAVRTAILINELYAATVKGQYAKFTIAKIVDNEVVDIWAISEPVISTVTTSEVNDFSVGNVNDFLDGEVVFRNPSDEFTWDKFDRSVETLNEIKTVLLLNGTNADDLDTVTFYELPEVKEISSRDAEFIMQAISNPSEPNEALKDAFNKRQQSLIDGINKAKAEEEAKVTDPVQKSFLKRLFEMIGI